MISVVIPVYHEAPRINHLLRSLSFPDTEILVVDGAPEQDTLAAIDVAAVQKIASPPGRGMQLNLGAAHAQGDILLFLHADTILPAHGLDLIRRAQRDPAISGGAFRLRYDSTRLGLAIIAALANRRSRWTRVPYGDQGIFVRAEVFRGLGGFAAIPIMEDLDFMTRLRRAGHAIRILDAPVLTSARRQEHEGLLRCTTRNLLLRLLHHLGVSPARLVRLYRPHRG